MQVPLYVGVLVRVLSHMCNPTLMYLLTGATVDHEPVTCGCDWGSTETVFLEPGIDSRHRLWLRSHERLDLHVSLAYVGGSATLKHTSSFDR